MGFWHPPVNPAPLHDNLLSAGVYQAPRLPLTKPHTIWTSREQPAGPPSSTACADPGGVKELVTV